MHAIHIRHMEQETGMVVLFQLSVIPGPTGLWNALLMVQALLWFEILWAQARIDIFLPVCKVSYW